jgi:type II secretory pathway predicted ATPase ExeA
MTPAVALEEQIKRYQAMTGEQRLQIALDLHELSCNIAREGIRHQHPRADAEEVERLLRHRLTLARTL